MALTDKTTIERAEPAIKKKPPLAESCATFIVSSDI
jgi:hypothetical protein